MFKICLFAVAIVVAVSAQPIENKDDDIHFEAVIPQISANIRLACSGFWGNINCNYRCRTAGLKRGDCVLGQCKCY